jgi:hypothetical protein
MQSVRVPLAERSATQGTCPALSPAAAPAAARGCVQQDTLRWAQGQAAQLPRVATSAAFIHIPVPQFMYGYLWGGGYNGSKGEAVNCPAGGAGARGRYTGRLAAGARLL